MTQYYFVHIPKTGGKYLYSLFHPKLQWLDHNGYNDTEVLGLGSLNNKEKIDKWGFVEGFDKRLEKKSISNNQLVTTIRNPFDMLGSYFFHSRSGWSNCNTIHNITTFTQFIDCIIDETFLWHHPALKYNLFWQIYKDDEIVLPYDNIFKIENLNNDIRNFLDRNNFDWDFKPSKHELKSYYSMYKRRQISSIESKYGFLFETFNY